MNWIERTYHRRRGQRRLGRLTPIEFETVFHRTFIRNNNNATWRNFNVVPADPADPTVQPFLVAGALDRRVEMQFEVIADLPERARLTLHAHEFALVERRNTPGAIKQGSVRLRPRGRQDLGRFLFPAKYKAELSLEVELPKENCETTGYSVTVRQLLAETGEELGPGHVVLRSTELV